MQPAPWFVQPLSPPAPSQNPCHAAHWSAGSAVDAPVQGTSGVHEAVQFACGSAPVALLGLHVAVIASQLNSCTHSSLQCACCCVPVASSLHVPVLWSQRYAGAGVGAGVGGVGGAVPWQSLSVIGTQLSLPSSFLH